MSLVMSVVLRDEEARNSLNELQNQAQHAGNKFKDVGANMAKIGAGVALGVGAIGGAMMTIATDADNANRKIQATLGSTAEETKAVADQARAVWKAGFTGSMEEASDAVLAVKQHMSELNDADLSKITQQAMSISQTFDEDVGAISRSADMLMKQFGISSEEAMDKITWGFQNNLNYSGEFLDSLSEYSVYANEFGMNVDQMMSMLQTGYENGAFQLDKVGDSIKESFLRLSDMGKGEQEAIKALGLSADTIMSQINAGGESASKAYEQVNMALASTKDETERNALMVALYGTQAEDVGMKVIEAMGGASNSIGDTTGKAQALNDTFSQSPAQQMAAQWNTMKDSLVPLATEMMKLGMEILPYISSGIEKLTGFMSGMSPETTKTVVAVGAVVGAIGGLLLVLSPVIGAIGSIIPLFAGAGAGAGIFAGALAVLTGPVGITIAAIVGIGTAVGLVAKDLSESSIEVESWKDKVSESTAKALGSFMDLSDEATTSLNQLSWSGQAVTQEMATKMTEIYSQMGDQVLNEMKADHAKELETMTQHFANTSSLSQAEETAILQRVQTHNAEREKATKAGTDRIKEIFANAAAENRAITENEQKEINSIQDTMKNNAIKHMTESEAEQKVILENLKNEASKITAEQAAEVVQNSLKQKDDVVKEANEQYDKTVEWAIRQRDETGTMSAEEAQKVIDDAKHKRDESIRNAEEIHEKVVGEAKSQAEEHVQNVDWETGEVLSKWQVYKNNVSSEWEAMWKDIDKWWGDMSDSITDSIDGAVKWVGDGIDKIKGFFTNLELKLPEIKLPKLPKIELTTTTKTIFGKDIDVPSIKWNAKGAIFKSPTIFNTANQGLQGVGEAGAEAVAPIDTLVGYVKTAVNDVIGQKGKRDIHIEQNFYVNGDLNEVEVERRTKKSLEQMGFAY
ncbi:phage tail tape measure protein [Lysinibacillus sp. FSL M8-0355]|uniref:phage tail tape measure protein n=1 Tax=Lysinibacillus sp. FSL M8-0355 TaxID=2921719 RepID=UPI0030FB564C